jgi:hypothetical protein
MKKISSLSVLCTLIFLIGIIASFLGVFNQGIKIMEWTTLIVSAIYLVSGWYLFKGYYPEGHPLLLFLMGYLYSSVFMALTFVTASWPLAKTFVAIAIAWAVTQLVMVTVIKKKLSREGFLQFMIEGSIMLIMSIAVLLHSI